MNDFNMWKNNCYSNVKSLQFYWIIIVGINLSIEYSNLSKKYASMLFDACTMYVIVIVALRHWKSNDTCR